MSQKPNKKKSEGKLKKFSNAKALPRLAIVDCLRGIALIAMTVFHFVYDLEFFGLKEFGYSDQLHWWLLATCVAGSFLFLAGFSLYLAHINQISWKPWFRRLATIVLSAFAITAITSYITPGLTVFFGILHMIAAASVLCLLFLRCPWWLIVLVAISVLIVSFYRTNIGLDHPFLVWLGLVSELPVSSDYRPVFPWLAPALIGLASARLCHQAGWFQKLAEINSASLPFKLICSLGRYSLLYYLLHQPVLFSGFWIGLYLFQ